MHRHHTWPLKSGPVTVIVGGFTTEHADLAAAVKDWGPYGFHLSEDGAAVLRGGNFLSPGKKARFYDGWGHMIDPGEVVDCAEACVRELRERRFFQVWGGRCDPAEFRSGPVPRTGKRGNYRALRRMRTTQERRAATAVVHDEEAAEHGIEARAARNATNLVSAHDDVSRARGGRSWKRSRRTQWK